MEPVLEHPTSRTAAKTNEAERNNFMFDHLLSKPSGFKEPFRAKQGGGNAESCIVTKTALHEMLRCTAPSQTTRPSFQANAMPISRATESLKLIGFYGKVSVAC